MEETTWTLQSDTTRWMLEQYESQLEFKIELDVEELGRESNLSMFNEMYGLKNCPTNWALVWGCKKNQHQSLSNDSRNDWSQHYKKISNPSVHQTRSSTSSLVT